MAGWTGKRVNVAFSKPEEPSFLKKFKERVGYKEDHGLSEKFAVMPDATDEDVADKDDELPQIVSLRSGDLSQDEVDRLRSEGRLDDLLKGNTEVEGEVQGPKNRDEVSEIDVPADGRILFRKPNKRSTNDSENKSKKVKKKAVQDKKLLSFDEDEEDEEC